MPSPVTNVGLASDEQWEMRTTEEAGLGARGLALIRHLCTGKWDCAETYGWAPTYREWPGECRTGEKVLVLGVDIPVLHKPSLRYSWKSFHRPSPLTDKLGSPAPIAWVNATYLESSKLEFFLLAGIAFPPPIWGWDLVW